MNPESYVEVGNRRLRRGYTTGTCAAGAAKAAVFLLLTGTVPEEISVNTPKGITVRLRAEECERGKDYARCAVRKDSGDDPDVTNGILIFAQVRRGEKGVMVDGGEGIVTRYSVLDGEHRDRGFGILEKQGVVTDAQTHYYVEIGLFLV